MTTQEAQIAINAGPTHPQYEEAKAFLEAQQVEGKKSSKANILKETLGAINRNQAGVGGASMSGAIPSIQQTIEENQVLDEVADATGQRPATILGHAVGQAVHPEDVAQDLKDRDIAVKDEYKEKHPDVFAEETPTEAVKSIAEPKKDDPPKVKAAKNRYNKATMSIWDAYYNGEFGMDENGNPTEDAKRTAAYFTIDAIANLAKNLGRGIGNVGAQFSGGTIDQGHDESMWEQRRDAIFNQELTGEAESIDNYNNLMKKYNLNKASTINTLMQTMEKDIANMDDDNPLKVTYMALEAAMANGMIDGNTTLAATGAKGLSSIIDWFKGEKDKK